MSKGDKEKRNIEFILRSKFKLEQIKREHKGIKGRQFRFDWAIPHINLAILNGWNVFRYTAKNYQELTHDLHHYLRDFTETMT